MMSGGKRRYHLALVIGCAAALHGFASGQTRVDGYLRELKNLDISRPESTCIARDSLRGLMPGSNVGERETMFRAFRAFYLGAVHLTAPAFLERMGEYVGDYEEWLDSAQAGSMQQFLKERPEIAETGSQWFKCGFSMYDGEGSLLPAQDPAILLSFADKLGPSLASYVRFRAEEDGERVVDDACLQVSWEGLRRKLERWEAFERGHRELPEAKSEMEPAIRWLASLYLFGADNTPTFSSRTGKIDPKLVASWSEFAAHDRWSLYRGLISSLVTSVSEQNQRVSQKDRPLFARYGMAASFDQWWRLVQMRLGPRSKPAAF
jgi:hypothetical protein